MRYGYVFYDEGYSETVFKKGCVFIFVDNNESYFCECNLPGEHRGGLSVARKRAIETTEEEYARLAILKHPDMHPKLKEVFEAEDFGCQTDGVRNILVAITKIMEDKDES